MTILSWSSPRLTTRTLTLTAFLIALNVVLGKLAVGSESLVKFSFGFLGTMLLGYFLGPWLGGVAKILYDLIANTLLATSSQFFIGFTLTAFISGVIAGMFLHNHKITWQRLVAYEAVQMLVTNLFFNTLWIHLLYQAPWAALIAVRGPKNLLMFPLEVILGLMVLRSVSRLKLSVTK
ncbi:membrane protein [Ligilactobacillus pabuli]|uniref:Membrane protein n=1 Tax=Ligilactobacillus pabuli TaxID=2886039 RepID=A0ABQ5JJ61_9LACO|nr:folate family ECF transporter S component [Ligilactobacillus pabuli]GKS81517.1 membrane protein [Ligilactobacillus pabuli]